MAAAISSQNISLWKDRCRYACSYEICSMMGLTTVSDDACGVAIRLCVCDELVGSHSGVVAALLTGCQLPALCG